MRILAAAGIGGAILFILLVFVQEFLNPDYSRIAMPISALAAWPTGWIQKLNFFVYGGLALAFYGGLTRGIRPSRLGQLGIVLLVVSAIGAILAGIFPWVRINGQPTETPRHVIGAISHFAGVALGSILLSRGMARDPAWSDIAGYVLGSGIALLVLFVTIGFFAIDPGTPLHPWAGLVQRVTVCVWFACMIVLGLRLWRVSSAPGRP